MSYFTFVTDQMISDLDMMREAMLNDDTQIDEQQNTPDKISSIIHSIKNHFKDTTNTASFETEPLDAKDRTQIHEYCRLNNLTSKSNDKQKGEKSMIISRRKEEDDNNLVKPDCLSYTYSKDHYKVVEMTRKLIQTFEEYSKIPIPTYDPELLQYYLETLEPMYDCKKMFGLFEKALKTTGKAFSQELHRTIDIIKTHIEKHPEYIKFKQEIKSQKIPDLGMGKCEIFKKENVGKFFVSVDVVSANFRCVKKFCPTMFSGEWKDFVKQFTDIEFLIESKMFREICLGKIFKGIVQTYPLVFIEKVFEMTKRDFPKMKPVSVLNDEIVYMVPKDFNKILFDDEVQQLLPNHFRVEMFMIKQLGEYDYFVKEFVQDSKKPQLRNVPRTNSIECLKHYFELPFDDRDLMFEKDDRLAKFVNRLF